MPLKAVHAPLHGGKKGSGGPSEPVQADGLIAVLSFRGQKTLLPSCLDALEEPGEVSPQVPHGLQALLVQNGLLWGRAEYHVPVSGGHHRHLGIGEVLGEHI